MGYKLTVSPYRSIEEQLRTAYQKMMREMSTRYHLTVTFKYGMNERVCNERLNELMKYLNRAILKNRYDKRGEYIKGVVVRESTYAMETVHYHIMIIDEESKLPTKERMEEIIEKKTDLINNKYGGRNQIGVLMLQEYYRNRGSDISLEGYLTKVFDKKTLTALEKSDSIEPLGHSGAHFSLLG